MSSVWYIYGAVVVFFAIKLYFRFTEKPVHLEPLKPVEPRGYKLMELKLFTKNPIYVAVKDKVYDVTMGSSFYGEDGPYSKLAGRDATYALAKMQTDPDLCDSKISASEQKVLSDWIAKFESKYPVVGYVSK